MNQVLDDPSFFRNCLTVSREGGGGWIPVRFSAAQMAEYALTEQFRNRSLCQAGTVIDLITDSAFIEFDYEILANCRDWLVFDVFRDGVQVESYRQQPLSNRHGHFRYSRADSGNEQRITIYLPQTTQLSIRGITVSGSSRSRPAPLYPKNLLCLGDSITQGMDAFHPSATYPVQLARFLEMNLINQGIGGYVFNARSLDPNLPFRPDLITVAYGTNDWGKCASRDEIRRNCTAYFEALIRIYPESKILGLTPLWRSDWQDIKASGSFSELTETIRETIASFPQITWVDGLELMPHLPEYFGDGRLHPNDEGFRIIALNLIKRIRN